MTSMTLTLTSTLTLTPTLPLTLTLTLTLTLALAPNPNLTLCRGRRVSGEGGRYECGHGRLHGRWQALELPWSYAKL